MRYREIVEGRSDPLDNPAFRRWFGDSQVVDSSGRPLVVYHGTNKDFSFFDPSMVASQTGNATSYLGHFFSESPKEAGRYAMDFSGLKGGVVMPVYLSLQNPKRLNYKDLNDISMAAFDASLSAGEWKTREGRDKISRARARSIQMAKDLRKQLIKDGHDGAVVKIGGIDEYIAFYPSQVKSAVGNSGRYSPGDRSMVGEGGIFEQPNSGDNDSLRERNFKKTREAQRYGIGVVGTRAPEDIGVNFKYGPILQALLEHIGDLVNRAALPSEDIGYGLEAIGEKVRRGLFYLKSDYSINEVIAQMERTGLYFIRQGEFADIEEFNRAADRELQEYVNAYRQIPVFTELQRLCRQAAIEIGSLNLWRAAYTLRRIERIIDSPDAKDAYDRMEAVRENKRMVGEGSIPRKRISDPIDPDDSESIGSGAFYNVVDKPEGDVSVRSSYDVKKVRDDAKVVWIRAIERLLKRGNPYVPRVYEIAINRYSERGKTVTKPQFRMERLWARDGLSDDFYDYSDDPILLDTFLGMVGGVSQNMREEMERNIRDRYKMADLWSTFVGNLRNVIRNGDIIYGDVDPRFMEVAALINKIVTKNEFRWYDLKESNFMVRKSPYGWVVVVTDPFV